MTRRTTSELTDQLLEVQRNRCAICLAYIENTRSVTKPTSAGTIKIDRSAPRTFDNSVVVCIKCAGRQSMEPSALAYYEKFIADGRKHRRNVKEQPDMESSVVEAIRAAYVARGGSPEIEIPPEYGRAPMERADHIANILFTKLKGSTFKQYNAEQRDNSREKTKIRKARWMNTGVLRAMMERQGHRCAYCSSVFDATDTFSPLAPTWEHVINMRDGGVSSKRNVVIACYACNSFRDEMKISAYEYFEWVQRHPEQIRRRIRLHEEHLVRARRDHGPQYRIKQLRKKQIFSH